MTSLEGDLRRMISNAKKINQKNTPAFSDSEKIRKQLSLFMQENNPAYKSPGYQPFTTPIPGEWNEDPQEQHVAQEQDVDGETDSEEVANITGKRTRLVTHVGSAKEADNSRASSTPFVQDAEGAYETFEGDTFQQAQEKIMTEMINLKDDEYVSSYGSFHLLADRKIKGSSEVRTVHKPSTSSPCRLLQDHKASCLP